MAGLTTVTSGGILDGTITNADINASASIDASKVSGLSTDSITEGNTTVEVVDTGSNGHITFDTEGSERMRIDSSGNVGIGITSPGANFHLEATVVPELRISHTGGTGRTELTGYHSTTKQFELVSYGPSSGATEGGDSLKLSNVADGPLLLYTNDTERMRIDSSGNVGIGTTSPSTKLEVDGDNQQIRCQVSSSKGVSLYGGSSSNTPAITYDDTLRFFDNGSGDGERLRVDSNGRVNIGQTVHNNVISEVGCQVNLGNLGNAAGVSLSSYTSSSTGGSSIQFIKTNQSTVGHTAVANNNVLGEIIFSGSDGAAYRNSALIGCKVDAVPTSGSVPGRIYFETSSQERWRITSDGTLQSKNSSALQVNTLQSTSGVPILENQTLNYYISDSGSDSTGDGSSSNPWRSLTKARDNMARLLPGSAYIINIKGPSYTPTTGCTFYGFGGVGRGGSSNEGLVIQGDGGAITYNMNNTGLGFEDFTCPIKIKNIDFVGKPDAGSTYNGMHFTRCRYVEVFSTCSWTTSCTGSWSWIGGLRAYNCDRIVWAADVTATSTATNGLGGMFLFDNCWHASFTADFVKSGTKYNQAAIVASNTTFLYHSGTINNFNHGIRLGWNHYGAEEGARCMLGNTNLLNCTVGVYLAYMSSLRAYYVPSSTGTTTLYSVNDDSSQH